jgi:hypothetical protein
MTLPGNWPTPDVAGYRHAGAAFDLSCYVGATDTQRAMSVFCFLIDQAGLNDFTAEEIIASMERLG